MQNPAADAAGFSSSKGVSMIRKTEIRDAGTIAQLADRLWPETGYERLYKEFEALLREETCAIFLAEQAGKPIGFAQCQLRHDYVEGTETSPVGYLEGIYVSESFRRRGVGSALVSACEDWAREKGCKEFASDCELTNTDSLRFHLATGFTEANRIICFVKEL